MCVYTRRPVLLAYAILLSGCASPTVYKSPLAEFSASVIRTRMAIETISEQANHVNTQNLGLTAALESKRFGANGLKEAIPPDAITARSYSLELIEKFVTRLLEVVDSNEGAMAAKAVENVGAKTQAFATQLQATETARYAGPVSVLAGQVIEAYDEKRREDILRQASQEGLPRAIAIIDQINQDFAPGAPTNIQEILQDMLKQNRKVRIDAYDVLLTSQDQLTPAEKISHDPVAERFEAIGYIISAQQRLDAANSEDLRDALNDLSKTLEELKKVIESDNDPKTLADFSTRLETFSNRSVLLLEAVNEVKNTGLE